MEVDHSKAKPHRGWIAAALTLILPGLGHFYGGRPRRALATHLGGILLIVAFLLSGTLRRFGGLIALVLAMAVFLLWAVADAARTARQSQGSALRPFHRRYLYLGVWLFVGLLVAPPLAVLLGAHSPVRAFQVPTGSMEPTIRPGDQVIADMSVYLSSKPARGDIAVISLPAKPAERLIKRVIGLEGEQVEIRDKAVFIDGKRLEDPWASHSSPPFEVRDNFGPVKIPPGSLFVLGDHRDTSVDSRQFGLIRRDSLQGRVLYVYWAADRSRIGTDLSR